jgi:hypothetical protein
MVALILTVGAIGAVWFLVGRASSSRVAQLQAGSVTISLDDLQTAPFNADPAAGGSPAAALARIRVDEVSISRGLAARSQAGVPASLLGAGRSELAEIEPVVMTIYGLAVGKGGLVGAGSRITRLQGEMVVDAKALSGVLAGSVWRMRRGQRLRGLRPSLAPRPPCCCC